LVENTAVLADMEQVRIKGHDEPVPARQLLAVGSGHEELSELCTAGNKASLAIGMTGLATELLWSGRAQEASRLASEQMSLLESIGDPTLTIGAAYVAIVIKGAICEMADVLRWSQSVIDLADGDPTKGANFAMGHRWGRRWDFVAPRDIGWACQGGIGTSTTGLRWPDAVIP
jgi:hypothetical protein